MSPASRSNGSRRAPAAQFIRFTEAQNTRLHRVARYRGRSIQAVVHEAAMKVIAEAEAEMRSEKVERDGRDPVRRQATGLGIADRLRTREDREIDASPTQLPTQLVIAAPPPVPGDAGGDLARLAKHVVSGGPNWSRPARLREAVRVLTSTTTNSDERNRLAKALDDQIAAIEGTGATLDLFERVKRGLLG